MGSVQTVKIFLSDSITHKSARADDSGRKNESKHHKTGLANRAKGANMAETSEKKNGVFRKLLECAHGCCLAVNIPDDSLKGTSQWAGLDQRGRRHIKTQ